ncbi:ATP-dependent DNA helicase RecG [Lacticigenium naphthae]|uniref:ATP-dependent DNA helicase RecG n=1 Tax=Lacticigenium naphthae TaxID=515351 RepID=UPI0004167EFF|nr:ATP-dependent DNA helicase RecG [Lacticigenium naphthae]
MNNQTKTIYNSVKNLPNVGEKRLEALAELEIFTIYDLLRHFPFRYEDLTVKDITEVEDKEKIVLIGEVVASPVVSYYAPKKNRLSFRIVSDKVVIPITFFNQHFLKNQINTGETIRVFGRWDSQKRSLQGIKLLSSDIEKKDYEPVYHTTKRIKQKTLVKLIDSALKDYYSLIPEIMPDFLVTKFKLLSNARSIQIIHFPNSEKESLIARRSLIFQEFFVYQLKMQEWKEKNKRVNHGIKKEYDLPKIKEFLSTLPFELTGAQKRVINEIAKDLKLPQQMYRLLQGDVGSGKTVVAATALFSTWTAGYQSAFMAPTEILAEQHMKNLSELFQSNDLTIELLTGSTKAKDRKRILTDLKTGKIDVLIGTHALIQKDVEYHSLGLVITDEQHRFGVNQRKVLREKGVHPDVLFMTATPIPRTLAISAFGDMDISTLDEMPSGRKPVKTYWLKNSQVEQVDTFTKKQLKNNSQVYVINPLIDESENMDLQNAVETYESYRNKFGKEYEIGLLHGKLPSKDKEEIMRAFKQNKIQILVSTTVIEVGVDVPNATLMIINDADRFGLAQLHQLRGRVGRGKKESTCILLANPKTENGKIRMQIMTETNDGFLLSEKDLELRGQGDIFGKQQSGVPQFKIGDLVEDFNILQVAREEAIKLIRSKEFQQEDSFVELKKHSQISMDDSIVLD